MLKETTEKWVAVLPKDLNLIGTNNVAFADICLRIISAILIQKISTGEFIESLQRTLYDLFGKSAIFMFSLTSFLHVISVCIPVFIPLQCIISDTHSLRIKIS